MSSTRTKSPVRHAGQATQRTRPAHSTTPSFIADSFAATNVGFRRDQNEDAVITDPERGIFLLADGMGGHPGGEIASSIAIAECHKSLVKLLAAGNDPKLALSTAFRQADVAVKAYGYENPRYRNMGSTLVVLVVRGPNAWVAHCGDSRAYLFRGGELMPITKDHGANGFLGRAIGCTFGPGPDVNRVPLMPGDTFLLCSDGLCTYVDHGVIEQEMRVARNCKDTSKALIDCALDVGGPDNVTVAVMRMA